MQRRCGQADHDSFLSNPLSFSSQRSKILQLIQELRINFIIYHLEKTKVAGSSETPIRLPNNIFSPARIQ
jgi:hypothetical protein